jgi:hypothetical protein
LIVHRATWAIVFAGVIFFTTSLSREVIAQTLGVALDYRGPSTCPPESRFWEALTTRTQRVQPTSHDAADVLLRIDLEDSDAGVLGRLEIVRDGFATEPRYVEASDCEGVLQALALTAALGIDPGALTRRPPPPATPMEPLPESTFEPTPWRRPSRWTSSLGFQFVGAQPVDLGASWGAAVSIAAHDKSGGIWAPVLRGGAALLQSDLFGSGDTARFTLITAFAHACVLHANAPRLQVRPCLGAQAGALQARGQNVSNPESSNSSWVSAALAVEAAYALSTRVSVQVDLAAHLPFRPQNFTQGQGLNREKIAQTSAIVPWIAAGLSYDL